MSQILKSAPRSLRVVSMMRSKAGPCVSMISILGRVSAGMSARIWPFTMLSGLARGASSWAAAPPRLPRGDKFAGGGECGRRRHAHEEDLAVRRIDVGLAA